MNLLLDALLELPEYQSLLSHLRVGRAAALSGVGQLPRTHGMAALIAAAERPRW